MINNSYKVVICFLHLSVTLAILSFGCPGTRNSKSEILPLSPFKFVDSIRTGENGPFQYLSVEYFIIINAPTDTSQLRSLIDIFNKSNYPKNVESFDRVQRIFYKESKNTRADYKETDEDILADHSRDIVSEVHWINKGKRTYYKFYKDGVLLWKSKDVELKVINSVD